MTALTREQQALVESALDEAIAFAKSMARRFRLLPHEAEDLVGEVRLELTKTVRLADTTRDINFIAYAFPSVRGAVLDSLARHRKSVVFARVAQAVRSEMFRESDDDEEEGGGLELSLAPSDPRSTSIEHIREKAARIAGAIVLSMPRTRGDDEMVELIDRRRFEAELHAGLATLPPRERRLVEMRHLEGKTLAEVAEALGDSVRTVQRLEKKVAEKLGLRMRAAFMARRPA